MKRCRHGSFALRCSLLLGCASAWILQGPACTRHPASTAICTMALSDGEMFMSASGAKRKGESFRDRCDSANPPRATWNADACKRMNIEFARRTNMVRACAWVHIKKESARARATRENEQRRQKQI